ncbi:MAG: glycoside hydrolase family 1 protein [Bacteroidota bacterium]|nr:glycoside hydrolase family 1 protein [Candidatus Kapabacteria bacterium]MDW8219299.1 glycoside hydrolase family 1 protein [Bacteroidota bacterium]
MPFLQFPATFHFGASSSAHQVEGNNYHNQWWRFEQESGRIKNGHVSGRASDHYYRYREDFADLYSMNHTAHRLSLEWSRFFPESPSKLNMEAVRHYHDVLDTLIRLNIEPFVTIFHFTIPCWFADIGGFEKEENIRYYLDFVRFLAQEYGNKVHFWCTINEPNIYASFAYLIGEYPPAYRNLRLTLKVLANLLKAHGKAYRILKQERPMSQVGIVVHLPVFAPLRKGSIGDKIAARLADWVFNEVILEALKTGTIHFPAGFFEHHEFLKDSNDFIGLNYYVRMFTSPRHAVATLLNMLRADLGIFQRTGVERLTQSGWTVYPKGLYKCLKRLHKKLGLPIYVTENGIATDDDEWRKVFIRKHLRQVHKALSKGIDIRGYFYWSNLDNFEWSFGFEPRFGLVHVDYDNDCRRTIRGSAWYYAEIIRQRGFWQYSEREESVGSVEAQDAATERK